MIQSSIAQLINILHELLNQSVEIQLKILQLILPLLTNYDCIYDELLSQALLIAFRLQESKIAVVSSTAAATLRQLVILVFDKLAKDADKDTQNISLEGIKLPSGQEAAVLPSLKDAFHVFQDLCLLTGAEPPVLLSKLRSLPKTLGLELLESVLTNHSLLFRKVSMTFWIFVAKDSVRRIGICLERDTVPSVDQMLHGQKRLSYLYASDASCLSHSQAIQQAAPHGM